MKKTSKTNKKTKGVGRSSKKKGRNYILGIGINKYQCWNPLFNAVRDMDAIIQLLHEQYLFEEKYTETLRDEEATEDNVLEVLERYIDKLKKADSLIIYYSGHGYLHPKTRKGYWVPVDARIDKTGDFISNTKILDIINAIKATHVLLISDSCFSGSFFSSGLTKSDLSIKELAMLPSRWGLSSGRHNELVFDGEKGKHSPFATSVLEVLSENPLMKMNVMKLVDQVIFYTRERSSQLPEGQPLLRSGHKGGQFIFRRKRTETPFVEDPPRQPLVTNFPMVKMAGGTFVRGSRRFNREQPMHSVKLTSFAIGKFPITFDQYDCFCQETNRIPPSDNGWGRTNRPVINVNWYDALAFCNWLSKTQKKKPYYYFYPNGKIEIDKKSKGYRLPTEAEWEYAAKGGVKGLSQNNASSSDLDAKAWFDKNAQYQTHPVGLKEPNAYGLYDMLGNVYEWCYDIWRHGCYKELDINQIILNPQGPNTGEERVIRGGAYRSKADYCRASYRENGDPNKSRSFIGFRVVCS